MPVYQYRAVDENGILIKNKVQEKSKQNLIKRLKANGLIPIDVTQTSFGKYQKVNKVNTNMQELMKIASETEANRGRSRRAFTVKEKISLALSQKQKITTRDLEIFTQNFFLLKKAGFNNVHALTTLIDTTDNISLKGILEDVLAGVEGGDYMYTTMEYYSDIFPHIYINLIKVGELSGSLDESLNQAVAYLESSETLKKKIRSKLLPSVFEFFVLLIILIAGSVYLIPVIQDVFDQVGSVETLPPMTMWFSRFLTQVQKVWYIPVIGISLIAALVYIRVQSPKGKYKWHYFKYTAPIFGQLIFAIDFSRLTNAMLLNLKNGMRIQEALEVSKNVVKNYVMLSMIEAAINNIIVGDSWIKPFEESGLPNRMITEMIKIGMQTDLPSMMEKLVEYMEIDIDNILQKIEKVLPQILYVVVGVMIIFITVVVLVPCIQVYMGTFLFSAAGF